VSGNTTGGNAQTGAANVVANVVNLLNSAWNWAGGALNFFAKNLFGNQTGDITLNPTAATGGGGSLGAAPSTISNTGPNSTNTISGLNNYSIQAVNAATGTINNNINVLANSGNAGVTGNTTGGNASSGNATATVDLLNLINASIGSGQSFFGLLNIFGNLNGDILFPLGFLTNALASGSGTTPATGAASVAGTGPNSTNGINQSTQNSVAITNSPTTSIANNISSGAQSGNATTAGNTTAGNATTGSATTNTNTYNLANTNLVGDNAVLVLVNVLGHWMGAIMNLPTANTSTSALLTGNATINGTGPSSNNQIGQSANNNLAITNTPVSTITNNVRAGAVSGDATVSNNTTGGNATSGNAAVATNVANIVNSSLNLSKWFGVLVVNVFGDWIGSVNKDTAAGNAPQVSSTVESTTPAATAQTLHAATITTPSQRIVASGNTGSTGTVPTNDTASQVSAKVLAATTQSPAQTKAIKQARDMSQLFMLSALMLMLAGALYGIGRKYNR
jgi:hypothetical protein